MVHTDFEIVSVDPENRDALYGLLEAQADILDPDDAPNRLSEGVRDTLYNAIAGDRECECFLVRDRKTHGIATAVTYYPCWTSEGPGLYLEDIVTSADHRRRGAGHFAMATLALRAVAGGCPNLRWECAAANVTAQHFYDGLGGERMTGRQTWRCEETGMIDAIHAPRLRVFEAAAESLCLPSLGHEGLCDAEGNLLAGAQFYRSYSTFRACSGLHLEKIDVPNQDPHHAQALLEGLWGAYRGSWGGHFDVTVRQDQAWLQPALQEMGFRPLTYGQGIMVPRLMRQQAVRRLAHEALPLRSATSLSNPAFA